MVSLFLTDSRCRLKPAGYMGDAGVQTCIAFFVSETVSSAIITVLPARDSFP